MLRAAFPGFLTSRGYRAAQTRPPSDREIRDERLIADLVNRRFRTEAPNRLWVADITFVRTWRGFCYTAFVTDACTKKIVGWAVSATMRTENLPLQALNHAVWQSKLSLSELVHHSDRRSQYRSLAYTDRLAELGIAPSVGSRGDSYDNALAEAVNAAFKTELINRGKPWRCIDDVELSTAEWVAWYTQERLHEALGYQTPAGYEAALTGTSHPASQPTPALATDYDLSPPFRAVVMRAEGSNRWTSRAFRTLSG